jgi:hypothetical protein
MTVTNWSLPGSVRVSEGASAVEQTGAAILADALRDVTCQSRSPQAGDGEIIVGTATSSPFVGLMLMHGGSMNWATRVHRSTG